MSEAANEALSQKLQSLLSSPDSLARIQSMMESLGGESGNLPFSLPLPANEEPPAPPPPSPQATDSPFASMLEPSMLTRLMPLLGGINKEDTDTHLLRALRPYLHGDKEKRLEDAIRMMQLMKMAPMLQQLTGKGGDSHG